jgi:hypothetical protein
MNMLQDPRKFSGLTYKKTNILHMKFLSTSLIALLTFIIIIPMFTSCDEGTELSPLMNASIKNSPWTSSNEIAQMQENMLTVSGIAEDGRTISFTLFGNSKGEYKVVNNSWEVEFGAFYKLTEFDELNDAYIAYEGVINLETVNFENRSVSGNFRFNAFRGSDTLKVENGNFRDLKFTQP